MCKNMTSETSYNSWRNVTFRLAGQCKFAIFWEIQARIDASAGYRSENEDRDWSQLAITWKARVSALYCYVKVRYYNRRDRRQTQARARNLTRQQLPRSL
jgi:hypothetical protein